MRVTPAIAADFEGVELDQFQKAERYVTASAEDTGTTDGTTPAAAGALVLLRKSPAHALAFWSMGTALSAQFGKPDTWTPYEHEMIDEVLALDAGHYGLLDIHLPLAVAAGIRIEAIEAIRDGRDGELDELEGHLVAFIRGVRDGTLDQATFDAVEDHLGSERGVVEYAIFVLTLNTHARLMQAFETPGMSRAELDSMIEGIKDGSVRLPSIEQYAVSNATRAGRQN